MDWERSVCKYFENRHCNQCSSSKICIGQNRYYICDGCSRKGADIAHLVCNKQFCELCIEEKSHPDDEHGTCPFCLKVMENEQVYYVLDTVQNEEKELRALNEKRQRFKKGLL